MKRLDHLVTAHVRSRTRAQRLIRQGFVRVRLASTVHAEDENAVGENSNAWKVATKPGEKFAEDIQIDILEAPEERFVSRAGLKLEALLNALSVRFDDCTVLDIGQSTGGFTDCALRFGAGQVIGIEVGHGQLDAGLRDDARVECLEGVNARRLPREVLARLAPQGVDAVVMDVSFISQRLILPEIAAVLSTGGELFSLVKPQFEVGPGKVDDRGVVRDAALYVELADTLKAACHEHGLCVDHWQESPIQGGDGNREFLLHARRR